MFKYVLSVKIVRYFGMICLFLGMGWMSYGQDRVGFEDAYRSWSLGQMREVLETDGLDQERKSLYVAHYLREAKKEGDAGHIMEAYKQQVWFLTDREEQEWYTDAALQFALKEQDAAMIGHVYNLKRHVAASHGDHEGSLQHSLLAEAYLKKIDDLYTLNEVRSFIGTDYYRFGNYPIAYLYYSHSAEYFEQESLRLGNHHEAYVHFRGYIYCLYGLTKSAYRMEDKRDTVAVLLDRWARGIGKMKPTDRGFEQAYYDLVKGMYLHDEGSYALSDTHLRQAIVGHRAGQDIRSEVLASLYLGKNLWVQGKRGASITYFAKADSLYQATGDLRNEHAEAYDYLIAYSEDIGDASGAVAYKDRQLSLLKRLQDEHRRMTALLQEPRVVADLEQTARISSNTKWWMVLNVVLVLLGIVWAVVYYRRKKSGRREEITESSAVERISVNDAVILEKLGTFEMEQGFLQEDLTLDLLARQIRCGRTAVSKVVSEYKGGFNMYIYRLRIAYLKSRLEADPSLRAQTIESLAQLAGFKNRKTFGTAFKKLEQINFTEYLAQLRS